MFAFYAIVLPIAMVWKLRKIYPHLPYRVKGGSASPYRCISYWCIYCDYSIPSSSRFITECGKLIY